MAKLIAVDQRIKVVDQNQWIMKNLWISALEAKF